MIKNNKTGFAKYAILLGHLAAILTVIAWGSSFIATKVLMVDGGFTPVEVYAYRFALAHSFLNVTAKSKM